MLSLFFTAIAIINPGNRSFEWSLKQFCFVIDIVKIFPFFIAQTTVFNHEKEERYHQICKVLIKKAHSSNTFFLVFGFCSYKIYYRQKLTGQHLQFRPIFSKVVMSGLLKQSFGHVLKKLCSEKFYLRKATAMDPVFLQNRIQCRYFPGTNFFRTTFFTEHVRTIAFIFRRFR